MMKKIYYLSTCDTCKRILKELPAEDFELQDIKKQPITNEELAVLYASTKSYEALINKRSQQFKVRNIDKNTLTEEDYKNLLLDHYAFLKRPVIIMGDQLFIGNNKKTIAAAREALSNG